VNKDGSCRVPGTGDEPDFRAGRLTTSQRIQTTLIAAAAYPAIAGLCRTITWKIEGAHHYDEILKSGRVPIIAFWHARILPATWFFRNRGVVALTSANFDGQWIARIIEHFGNRTVAGSTSRGGMRALLALKREVERGQPAAFALDGPRGPARVAQPGAVWLAGATGCPLLPFHAEASRSWTVSSWDRTQVPKPFSTVTIVVGEPLIVAGTSESALNLGSVRLAEILAENESRAAQLLERRAAGHFAGES
jgi:lysophospholipid acyltransferase (LPLAT)-like uncharacterized protein